MPRLLIIKGFILLLLPLLLFVVVSCEHHTSPHGADIYTREGKTYGVTKGLFRERWWNFYERGCSFASGGFWNEAIADFREALRQRAQESYRARTYGMHFIDYFPHRELGIAYYHTAQYQRAVEELTTSLSQVETAKAKYFLNKVHREILNCSSLDVAPPMVSNLSLSDGEITNLFEVELRGVVEDDTFVSSVAINGSPLFVELAEQKISFTRKVVLTRGKNVIYIEAKDLTDKITTHQIRVLVDREGPMVAISGPLEDEVVRSPRVTLKGLLWDESGVASLTLNGAKVILHGKGNVSFHHEVVLREGRNTFSFVATDSVGNPTRGEIHLIGELHPPGAKLSSAPLTRLALLDNVVTDFEGPPLFVKAKAGDCTPPLIRLKELTDSQTVYYDTIFIEGSAVDQSEISEVIINAVPLHVRPCRNLFFNYLAHLEEGANRFDIRVSDVGGNTADKTVTIVRKTPRVRQVGSRLSITVLPFEHKGKTSFLGSLVYDGLVDALVNKARFNVVGRGRDLEVALTELKLSQTDLIDAKKALHLGRVIAAEGIITGTIFETPDSLEIYARLVDSETATVLAAKDVFEQDKSLSTLRFILRGLALKFEQSFPLLEGNVIKRKEKTVYIDKGLKSGLKQEMKAIVFREGAPLLHPLTGKYLGSDTIELAEVRIEEVFDAFSIGKVLKRSSDMEIHEKDSVIMK